MSNIEQFHYDNRVVRAFGTAAFIWGVVGMLVGLILALQLIFPVLNLSEGGFQYLTFGRLRPLHTNAVIFAFVGNGIFMGVYYRYNGCSRRVCLATNSLGYIFGAGNSLFYALLIPCPWA
jgi:cbb3-type cytochrome oxidase subunit 1